MPATSNLVTGATGLLGSHLVEQLVHRGERVRALVRPSSDTQFIERLGVELAVGDLCRRETLGDAFRGAERVFHCAAKVGDWGPWSDFHQQTVLTTRNVVEACREHAVDRLLHVSSVSAYGHPEGSDNGIAEDAPLGQNLWLWDYYARSKMDAEAEVRQLGRRTTIVRPAWIYGPRDRAIMPRILGTLEAGSTRLMGTGENLLNMVHARDAAEGVVLAATAPEAAGEAFNICGGGEITQRDLFARLCKHLGLPEVRRRVPLWLVYRFAFCLESVCRLIRRKTAPLITRHGVSLISRPTSFSTRKAEEVLGWRPRVGIDEGLQETLSWIAGKKGSGLICAKHPSGRSGK